ncbi:TetR/AcrR family transcriptional regulator [Streptomyces sp. NPDC051572]|uniref:TetR/AcrR family transcriptional regulator n=1 Tax=unclassified Streptomyces TaxID=2593676 RepID=UPI00344EEF15
MSGGQADVAVDKTGRPRARNPRGEGQRLRQEILDAAGRLLEESGQPEAVSLRAIAREAGVTSAAVYKQFKDKSELMWVLLDDVYKALAEEMKAARLAAPADDPWAGLCAAVNAYCRYAVDRPRRYELLFHTGPALPPPERPAYHPMNRLLSAWRQAVAPYVDEEPDRGGPLTGDRVAKLLWSGLHGQFGLWRNAPEAIGEKELMALRDSLMFALFGRC